MKRILPFAFLLVSASVPALEIVPFEARDFARAQREGRTTAIQFHSGWCPVCVMQERGVRSLHGEAAYARVIVFQADFFREEALRKRYKVDSFSTLVVFRGEQERSRSTGEFKAEKLGPLFARALTAD